MNFEYFLNWNCSNLVVNIVGEQSDDSGQPQANTYASTCVKYLYKYFCCRCMYATVSNFYTVVGFPNNKHVHCRTDFN